MLVEVHWSATLTSHLGSSHPRLVLVHTSSARDHGIGLAEFEDASWVRGGVVGCLLGSWGGLGRLGRLAVSINRG